MYKLEGKLKMATKIQIFQGRTKDGWPLLHLHWPESMCCGENAEVTVHRVETKQPETAVGRIKCLMHEPTNACLSSVLNINSLA